MDDALIDCINYTCDRPLCSFSAELAISTDAALEVVQPDRSLSQVQMADLLVTKQWLQVKIWQASVMHMTIDQSSLFPQLRLEYPLSKLVNVINIIDGIPFSALLGNGQGMVSLLLPMTSDLY